VRLGQALDVDFGDRREGLASRDVDGVDLEVRERGDEPVECPGGDGDLEILVLATLAAEEEVDRPAGRDVPGRIDTGET
jgi:hypothetical protein